MTGHVDIFTPELISGWAHNPSCPQQRVLVSVHIAGNCVGTVVAEHFRADLRQAGIGDGWKAFYFDPRRFLPEAGAEVKVGVSLTGEILPNGAGWLSRPKGLSGEDWDLPLPSVAADRFSGAQQAGQDSPPRPHFTVLAHIHARTTAADLERSVLSLVRQTYSNWQLRLAADVSEPSAGHWHRTLQQLAATHPRINAHLVARSHDLTTAHLANAHGPASCIACFNIGDSLHPEAMEEMAAHTLRHPEADAVYCDHDVRNQAGEFMEAHHKPAWSPTLLLGTAYADGLLIMRSSLFAKLHQSAGAAELLRGHDLLRLLFESQARVQHLPRILLHRSSLSPFPAWHHGHAQACLDRLGLPLEAQPHPALPGRVLLRPRVAIHTPRISVIVPTRDQPEKIRACLRSLFALTSHPDMEVVVADNGTTDPAALDVLSSHPIRWLKDPSAPFNFSAVNNRAARSATGQILVFLNNDTEVLSPDWLQTMAGHLQLPGVGVVGPQLLYPDGTVQHAGMVLGFRGTADHVMRGFPADCDGHRGSLPCSREVSAVTGACLMITRRLYDELGGFDEAYRLVYQDVDLCLRAGRAGQSTVYAAGARLLHHESATRGAEYETDDRTLFLRRWSEAVARGDPYFNPHFTRNRTDYCRRPQPA